MIILLNGQYYFSINTKKPIEQLNLWRNLLKNFKNFEIYSNEKEL